MKTEKKLSIKLNNKINSVEINISGELTIDTVEDIIKDINPAIDKFQSFVINVNDIDDIDLPGIQFLISLEKTIIANDKNIEFKINLKDKFKNVIERTGLKI